MSNSHVASPTAEQAPDSVTAAPKTPSKLTFRITPMAFFAIALLALCVTPVACARTWLLPLYLVPLVLAAWVLRVRTTVTANGVVARTMTATRRLTWEDIASFQPSARRYVRAVPHSGRAVTLPSVRVRDLGHLAALSGGRLSDPSVPVDSDVASDEPGEPSDEANAATDEATTPASETTDAPDATKNTAPSDAERTD